MGKSVTPGSPAVRMRPETIHRLKQFKLIDQDTYDNVINRALDALQAEYESERTESDEV